MVAGHPIAPSDSAEFGHVLQSIGALTSPRLALDLLS